MFSTVDVATIYCRYYAWNCERYYLSFLFIFISTLLYFVYYNCFCI